MLDLLRIHIRLHDVNRSMGIGKLLQVTCQRSFDAISFAIPTESGGIEDGVILPGLDVETVGPSFDNRSIYLVILVTANSNNILTYSIFVKIYDRAQYNVILRAPKFSRAVLNQKISTIIPIAFRVHISDVSVRMLKIAVKSNDNSCAFMVVQNYSTAFLHSGMHTSYSMRVAFTRKASLIVLANSPLHVFVMMVNDDRACNTFAPNRAFAFEKYNSRKKLDIKFSRVESISLCPLVVTMFYLTLTIIFLASNQLMPHLHDSQDGSDIPLIVLLDGDSSGIPSSSSHQEIIPVNNSHNILADIQMKEKQQPMKDTALLKATEQCSISTDTNEITMRSSENVFHLNWNAYIPYCASLPVVLQYFYTLLLDQLMLIKDNLDACYYNMECSVTLGPFKTFNHMYSNIGYKYCMYRRYAKYSYCPHVFLNVGIMMCLEAFASAFYHICPNSSAFHNDTLFVEIALVLLMVRFYFARRGGISLSGIFQSISFTISFHFTSNMLKDNFYSLWIILTSGLLLLIAFQYHLLFSSQSSVESIPLRDWRKWLVYCRQLLAGNGRDKSLRLKKILLVCITACNIALALLFETSLLQTSFMTLYITMLNAAGYFIYYISCKIINGETVLIHAFVYTIASFLLWIAAFYFFNRDKTDWTLTAAQNHAVDEECIMFQYFDYHDIWHFTSSLASFFSLLAVAVLDDDIMISDSDFDRQIISTF
uniref:Cadherin domain-containing protein n=1 Tax=Loa loa TaxID=7209 RepID=A0A1I7VSQ5_LOALO